MESTTDPAALAECLAPLSEVDRRAVRRYWERVIREEWARAGRDRSGVSPVMVAVDECGELFGRPWVGDSRRRRREARRAVARILAAGRAARVVVPAASSAAECRVLGDEAA